MRRHHRILLTISAFCSFLLSGGLGAPAVTSVSAPGIVAHGSTVSILGQGFGTKTVPAPAAAWLGETADLNGLTHQTNYLSVIGAPSATGQKRGQENFNIRFNPGPDPTPANQFVAGFSYEHNSPSWYLQYWIMLDPNWHWGTNGNTDPRWANTKIFRMWHKPDGPNQGSNVLSATSPSTDLLTGTESYGDGTIDTSNQIRIWPGTLPGTQGHGTAMAPHSPLPLGVLCNEADLIWKVTTAGTCSTSKPVSPTNGFSSGRRPKIGDTVVDNEVVWTAISSLHTYWTTDGTYGTYYHNVANRITHDGFCRLMTPGVWHLIQVEYQESSGANMPDGRIHMWFDGTKVLTHDAFITSWATDGPHALKGPALIGFYDSWAESAMAQNPSYIWLQDVVADTTWARVEIGNHPDYSACTHREFQTASVWNDGTVTIKLNQGSFATGATVYLFVVDSAGQVNATGYPVTIGSPPGSIADYTTWRTANFTGADLTNNAISGPNADPDRCGLANLARYAFALPARGPVANPITTGTTTVGSDTFLTLTFPRRTAADGLTYTLESSTDLVTWTAVPDRTYTAGSGPITAEDIVALGDLTAPRRFLRLRISVSP